MLIDSIETYIALRQALGYKLRNAARNLRAFGRFATVRGDEYVCSETAIEWASTAKTPHARHIYLRDVVKLARFLAAENPAHDVPKMTTTGAVFVRPLPYIYTPDEIARIVAAAHQLRSSYPLRRAVYSTLLGLIASTGLRVSEALNLRFRDIESDGILNVRSTKFRKSRLIPLHPTTTAALDSYLVVRRPIAPDDTVFLSAGNKRISSSTVNNTFLRILKLAGIAPQRARKPRIQDLRTFATRALEKCSAERNAAARHFVALSTYLGHVDIRATYWYLEATPELMTDIADSAERLTERGDL